MAIKQDADAFSKAVAATGEVTRLVKEKKEMRATHRKHMIELNTALKKARTEASAQRKAVLDALGRKPRGPRKVKTQPTSPQVASTFAGSPAEE